MCSVKSSSLISRVFRFLSQDMAGFRKPSTRIALSWVPAWLVFQIGCRSRFWKLVRIRNCKLQDCRSQKGPRAGSSMLRNPQSAPWDFDHQYSKASPFFEQVSLSFLEIRIANCRIADCKASRSRHFALFAICNPAIENFDHQYSKATPFFEPQAPAGLAAVAVSC